MRATEYPFVVRPLKADEGGGYLIEYPDLPGFLSDGEAVEEAIRNGQDALTAWLAMAKQCNDAVPSASGQWRQRVPRTVHAQLVMLASIEGVSLNTLVTSFISEGLGRRMATRGARKQTSSRKKTRKT